ncbi:Cytosine-specific methyltransferase [Sulfurovum sp. enrichment culture clone C5]|uniref:Cytosine-specific methyltransferase n=1 Tax=Sulfurovum sp. enrichment culture clone C5 TaxID=497650 RepID=A0A0S4XP00_9BACT|nr:Cytosine-specific methyltransferase [Sulfurovum sp. enrichment culture clone C5]
MKVGGLFAGIGGIELGFKKAGFEIAWANEIDSRACSTYRANHSHTLIHKDLKDFEPTEVEKIDILTGGFPCQAFSVAGHRKGFKDERGNVFFEILKFIDAMNPKVVFLENVKNLASHDEGKTFERIKKELQDRHYHIKYQILNSAEFGNIPQNRERIYIVAFSDKGSADKFVFPKSIKRTKRIQDIIDPIADEIFYYHKSKLYPTLKEHITSRETVYQWRRKYVRENKSKLCPTLTANMGTGGHNVPLILDSKDIRKLTPRECARLQGYDDCFVLPNSLPNSALYKQIGNSVSIPVVEAIAKEIKKAIWSECVR